MKTKNTTGYLFAIVMATIIPQLLLFMSRDIEKGGSSLYLNNFYVMAIIVAMWVPGLLAAITIERRMDRLEKLLKENDK